MGHPAPSESVDRFGLDPRPPSPPPAFLRLPWWLRWPIGYTVVGVLYAGWAQAVVGKTSRAEVAWFAVPYLATPMVVLVVLLVRSGRGGSALDTPRPFAWGATLSLVSIFLFTLGYAGWPLMISHHTGRAAAPQPLIRRALDPTLTSAYGTPIRPGERDRPPEEVEARVSDDEHQIGEVADEVGLSLRTTRHHEDVRLGMVKDLEPLGSTLEEMRTSEAGADRLRQEVRGRRRVSSRRWP